MSCLPAYRTDAIYREVNMDRYDDRSICEESGGGFEKSMASPFCGYTNHDWLEPDMWILARLRRFFVQESEQQDKLFQQMMLYTVHTVIYPGLIKMSESLILMMCVME